MAATACARHIPWAPTAARRTLEARPAQFLAHSSRLTSETNPQWCNPQREEIGGREERAANELDPD